MAGDNGGQARDPKPGEELPYVDLVIRYTIASRSVKVGGPLEEELFCLGLLAKARTIIEDHNKKANRITPIRRVGRFAYGLFKR